MRFISILQRALSKFLGTDVRYLAAGSFWLSLNKVTNIIVALLISVAYARYISKDTYGTYRYIVSFIGMFGIFAVPGMGTTIIRSIARGYAGTFKYAAATMFLFSWGISFSCVAAAIYFHLQGVFALSVGFFLAAFLVPFSEGLGAWRSYYTGTKQFQKGMIFSSATQLLYGVVMLGGIAGITLYQFSNIAALGLLVGIYLTAHAVPNIILTRRVWNRIPSSLPKDPQAPRYGIHLSVSEIPSIVATYVDSLLLFSLLGAESLAVFSFAFAPVEQLKSIIGTAGTVSMPKIAEKTATPQARAALRSSLPKKLFRASLFTAGAVGAYVLAAPLLFDILFPQYTQAVPFTQVLALSLISLPLSMFGTTLKAEGNLKKIYIFSIGAPLVQILAMFILIPVFGIWGAVWARVGGRLFNHALLTYLYL
ncbi:MAG: polysaccharide biosynthesis protein [Parcubacteria group bacterium Gr01-1014_29]|nr:MAG: polysaccharide biosynthesis protein [Parcubacteria group bacterium Gr01-1014_29]